MWYKYSQETEKPIEYMLGEVQKGPVKDALEAMGLSHENYKIPKGVWPNNRDYETFQNKKLVGQGVEKFVYLNPETNMIEKYPKKKGDISTSTVSFKDKIVETTRTDFDKLIRTFERVMQLRIFARVVNEYNDLYYKMNPSNSEKLPKLAVPDYKVDANAVLYEPLLPEDRRELQSGDYKKELLNSMPYVIKSIFFYFDPFGKGNVFQTGFSEDNSPNKRPLYNVVDGAKIRDFEGDADFYLSESESWHEAQNRRYPERYRKPFNKEKTLKDLQKFQEIVKRISNEEFQRVVAEIQNLFKDYKPQ